jgi:hypothetical protein
LPYPSGLPQQRITSGGSVLRAELFHRLDDEFDFGLAGALNQ